jgi:membrane protein DedA with SNARE-associated domain
MTKPTKEFLKYAGLPIVLFTVLVLILFFYQFFDLPTYSEITQYAKDMFAVYGYWVVFIGAIAEGILFFNWYLPGSVVVVMGVVFGQENGLSVFWVVNLITLGFFITTVLNYALGRYGWYRLLLKFGLRDAIEKAKKRVKNKGLKIIFGTYFHPNVGALTATSAGILKLSFKTFCLYSLAALLAWNALWGVVVYTWGPSLVELVNYKSLLIIIGLWIVAMLIQFIRIKRRKMAPATEEVEV